MQLTFLWNMSIFRAHFEPRTPLMAIADRGRGESRKCPKVENAISDRAKSTKNGLRVNWPLGMTFHCTEARSWHFVCFFAQTFPKFH